MVAAAMINRRAWLHVAGPDHGAGIVADDARPPDGTTAVVVADEVAFPVDRSAAGLIAADVDLVGISRPGGGLGAAPSMARAAMASETMVVFMILRWLNFADSDARPLALFER